jgi:hypothetical protein
MVRRDKGATTHHYEWVAQYGTKTSKRSRDAPPSAPVGGGGPPHPFGAGTAASKLSTSKNGTDATLTRTHTHQKNGVRHCRLPALPP